MTGGIKWEHTARTKQGLLWLLTRGEFSALSHLALDPHPATPWKRPPPAVRGATRAEAQNLTCRCWETGLAIPRPRPRMLILGIVEGHGNPLLYSCLENPMDRGTWRATVHGFAKSRTQLSDWHYGANDSKRWLNKLNRFSAVQQVLSWTGAQGTCQLQEGDL